MVGQHVVEVLEKNPAALDVAMADYRQERQTHLSQTCGILWSPLMARQETAL